MDKIKHLINKEITKATVRLVDGPDGDKVMSLKEALILGEELGLDIVMVSDGDIPVCKMMDYQKYLYIQKKSKKPQKSAQLKEIKFGYQIAEHDLKISAKKAQNILDEGHKVKAVVVYRGREMKQISGGKAILDKFLTYLSGEISVIKSPMIEGNMYSMQIEKKKSK